MSITSERTQNAFPIEKIFEDRIYENCVTDFVRKHRTLTTDLVTFF